MLEWQPGPQPLIPQRKRCGRLCSRRVRRWCCPGADGSIGFGTYRDISLATDLNVSVLVVSNDGRLWPLGQAGLVLVPNPGSNHESRCVAGQFQVAECVGVTALDVNQSWAS